MNRKIRVIVVDDSALVRSLLAEIINRQPDMECIGTANDPLVAREMIREQNPDVITLDVEMPKMDGIDFLGRLMRLRPMPVLMISTLTERGAEVTMRALELGAVDFVAKPRVGVANGLQQLATEIVDKIRVASVAHVHRTVERAAATAAKTAAAGATGVAAPASSASLLGRLSTEKIIAIGASTGGYRGHQRSAHAHACGRACDCHHPAHAAWLYHQLCGALEQPVPNHGERGDPWRAFAARPCLHCSGWQAVCDFSQRSELCGRGG